MVRAIDEWINVHLHALRERLVIFGQLWQDVQCLDTTLNLTGRQAKKKKSGSYFKHYLQLHTTWQSANLQCNNCTFRFYNCTNCNQLHVKICPEEEQSVKLVLRRLCVRSVSDFVFSASAYEGGWPVLSHAISSSHWQCMVYVLIIARLARGCRWSRNIKSNFYPRGDLNPNFSVDILECQPPHYTNVSSWRKVCPLR